MIIDLEDNTDIPEEIIEDTSDLSIIHGDFITQSSLARLVWDMTNLTRAMTASLNLGDADRSLTVDPGCSDEGATVELDYQNKLDTHPLFLAIKDIFMDASDLCSNGAEHNDESYEETFIITPARSQHEALFSLEYTLARLSGLKEKEHMYPGWQDKLTIYTEALTKLTPNSKPVRRRLVVPANLHLTLSFTDEREVDEFVKHTLKSFSVYEFPEAWKFPCIEVNVSVDKSADDWKIIASDVA